MRAEGGGLWVGSSREAGMGGKWTQGMGLLTAGCHVLPPTLILLVRRQQLAKALQKAGLPGPKSRSHSRGTRRRIKAFIKVRWCTTWAVAG